MNIIPAIGASGLYTLNPPFAAVLTPNISYSCTAAQRISDLIAIGTNVFETIYQPADLSSAVYERDLAQGASIVTLVGTDGTRVGIPSTYIAGYPDPNGVPYSAMMVALNLGALPDTMDLTFLCTKLESVVTTNLGVTSQAQLVKVSAQELMSQSASAAIEAARDANVTSRQTDYAQLLAMTQERDQLQERVNLLEAWIVDHHTP